MPIYVIIPRYSLIISIRSHSHKWPWRDCQPLYHVGCEVLICLCRCVGLERGLLLDWYLDSKKTEGNTYATLLHHPFLFKGKQTQCSRRISGAVAGEIRTKSSQVRTYQVPITNSYPTHYIICHLPLFFLSPTSPSSFYSPSLFRSPLFRLLLVCSCVWLLACHYGST